MRPIIKGQRRLNLRPVRDPWSGPRRDRLCERLYRGKQKACRHRSADNRRRPVTETIPNDRNLGSPNHPTIKRRSDLRVETGASKKIERHVRCLLFLPASRAPTTVPIEERNLAGRRVSIRKLI